MHRWDDFCGRLWNWTGSFRPWTDVYGLARTLLALGTAGTLAFSDASSLFRPGQGGVESLSCNGLSAASLYCYLPDQLRLARWITIVLLLVVASGWRPRVTGLLHWYLSFSFAVSATVVDGGDHVTLVLTLLLVPITLTDSRRWHWDASPPGPTALRGRVAALVAASAWLALRVQVAGIYFHAGVAKLFVPEWADGTALYYWFNDSSFGAPDWLAPITDAVLMNPMGVTLATWSVLVLEIGLAAALVMPKRWWGPMLVFGIAFHLGIALVHGLISFVFAMSAALILFLRPLDRPFGAKNRIRRFTKRTALPGRAPTPVRSSSAPDTAPAPSPDPILA